MFPFIASVIFKQFARAISPISKISPTTAGLALVLSKTFLPLDMQNFLCK